ncbi:MAG: hypothetical protein RL693_1221 [Verrucomicrobiota bacterium]|jgi:glutamine amidotransferase-like uncharacterized protein
MKVAIRIILLPFLILITPALGALDFLVLDSAKPGATLIVLASESDAAVAALRQLQRSKPERGCLVLAHSRADFQDVEKPSGWESTADLTSLAARFRDAHELVLSEDEEAHAFDKHFHGDTVRGSSEASSRVLMALRGLESDILGKDWQALPEPGQIRRTVVTTNARLDMEGGLRPVVCEREFRTAAAAMQRQLSMIDEGGEKARIFPESRSGQIRVAVYDGPGAQNSVGRGPAWLRSRLARDPGLLPELVDGRDIREGVLNHVDVLLIGGGKATPQSEGLGKEGREIVSKFVRDGGGYVGICAGAYLGSNGSGKWNYLDLLPVETKGTDTHCKTPLVWSINPLGDNHRVENAELKGGPIFSLMEPDSSSVHVWASFERNETNENKTEYPLKGTPAVISGLHGKGKVVLFSTHCERPPSPSNIFPEMLRWTARDLPGNGE